MQEFSRISIIDEESKVPRKEESSLLSLMKNRMFHVKRRENDNNKGAVGGPKRGKKREEK